MVERNVLNHQQIGTLNREVPSDYSPDVIMGDVLIIESLRDPFFKGLLVSHGESLADFFQESDDLLALLPERIFQKIERVGGKGEVIRLIGVTLDNLDNYGLNGYRDIIELELGMQREDLRRRYRLEKKSSKVFSA